jgi:uncharacterized membrane protein (DUF106 family)
MINLIIIFVSIIIYIWLAWIISQAPYMDDDGNIIKKDKNDIPID